MFSGPNTCLCWARQTGDPSPFAVQPLPSDPFYLIEYWSVDPDFDGVTFRSVWQDYRSNTENDADLMRVVREARLENLPVKTGPRQVAVRVVDVFGFESEVVETVG